MKKIVKILGGIFIVFIALLVLLPILFKGKLVQFAKDEINRNVNAQVDFKSASLNLFSSFPDFNLNLNGLSIVGKEKFSGDTLLAMDALSFDIDLMSVFHGAPYEIKKLELNKPFMHIIFLSDGDVNYDITLPSTDTLTVRSSDDISPFVLRMKEIKILNGTVIYDDRDLDFRMAVEKVDGSLSGDLSADLAEIQTKLNANKLSVTYEGFDYLSNVKADFSSLIVADMKTGTYTLKNTEAILNQLRIGFEGSFVLGEADYTMDFSFNSKDNNFKHFLSLLPLVYTRQFDQLKADGSFALNGRVNGIYSDNTMPGFKIDLKIDNASVRYPDLPKRIESIFVLLSINNETGILDNTVIELSKFKMKIAENPIEATLRLKTPISDPDFKMSLNGNLDLNSLKEVIPLEPNEFVNGKLDFMLSFKSKMSDIEHKNYNQIMASGQLKAEDIHYKSQLYGLPVVIRKAELEFMPTSVLLAQLEVLVGKSDFKGSGQVDDFLPYYLSDGILKGKMNLSSDLIDVNELLSSMAQDTNSKVQTDTTKLALVLPARYDFSFSAKAKKVVYEKYELSHATASLDYKNQRLSFNPLSAELLGGSMKMEGMFDGAESETHPFNFDFNMVNFDIYPSYQTIGLFKKAMPIAEKMKGKFSVGFRLKGNMDSDLNLAYETLFGGGKFQTLQVAIEGVKTMEQLAELLGNEKYGKLQAKDLNFSFEIVNGKVYQKPFKIKYADTDATIGGNIGFDQKLDFDVIVQIPYQSLGKNVQSGITKLITAGENLGIPIDPGTTIQVKAKINGMVKDPKVAIDYKDFLSSRKTDLVAKVNQELEKQKEALTEKAKDEVEKLLKQAKQESDLLLAEAQQAAAKIRSEALKAAEAVKNEANKKADILIAEATKKGPIAVLAAKEAAKKVRSEGDKAANKLIQEADLKSSNLITQAQKKADEILLKAQAESDKI